MLGLSHERCGGGSFSSPCRAKPRGGPGRRHPPRWRGGGGGDGRAPLPRTPAAASWPGREPGRREHVGRRLRASGAGSAGLSSADPGRHGAMAAAGGNPPRRAARPPPRSALPGLGSVQGCRRPRRRAGTDGSGERDGESGTDKGKAEPPLPSLDSPLRGAGIQPLRPGLGAPGGAAAGRGWERRMGAGKERKEGRKGREEEREGERKKLKRERERKRDREREICCHYLAAPPVSTPWQSPTAQPASPPSPTGPHHCPSDAPPKPAPPSPPRRAVAARSSPP